MHTKSQAPVLVEDHPSDQRPLLFISHRHADKAIADVFRNFVNTYSGGRINIFQSSAVGYSTSVGSDLNHELSDKLKAATVLILLYTSKAEDWSYCMWECGVALDPSVPTNIIVFEFAGHSPAPFSDLVRVNARDLTSVHGFTQQLLTSPNFFPELTGAVAPHFTKTGEEVKNAAQDLYYKLQDASPPDDYALPEEWKVWPFLRLEIQLHHQVEISDQRYRDERSTAQVETGHPTALDLVQQYAVVQAGDNALWQLFGSMGHRVGMTLQELAYIWQSKKTNPQVEWLKVLCLQIAEATQDQWMTLPWAPIEGVDNNCYIPVLTCVRKIPSLSCMQFDVYFYRFDPASSDQDRIATSRSRPMNWLTKRRST